MLIWSLIMRNSIVENKPEEECGEKKHRDRNNDKAKGDI
jgi:hypothetical protein